MELEFPEEREAFEPAERLADLLMMSYEPMLVWDLDGAIKFWNTGAERLYGFRRDEAVGRVSHSLLKTKFPIDLAAVAFAASRRSISGPASCATPAWTAMTSPSTAGCS